ncbi:hypothetical protein HY256_04970, partial [Candidatus Sumerlaeota bacterium]|nr:hypothetical protein [Candidatus Sumerlaeota bacterium]
MRLETACRGRFSYHLRLEIRIFVFAMIAASASAAPPFVASGRVEELRKLIVAEDSGGPVSAFDVLLYLDMARRPAVAIPAAQWLATGEKRDAGTWKSIRGAVEEYLAVRSLARGAAPAEAPDYLKRNMIYSAAEAAWIQTQIIERGEISITQTDINRYYIANPQLYSSDSRAEVRYIFLPVRDMTQPADIADAEKDLKGIREKVARGEITFGEAATRFSQ